MNELAKMNTRQVQALQAKTNLVFLPIGPTEVHAPHLPLSCDVISACEMSERAAAKLADRGIESLIASPVYYCLADVANCFTGNTTLRASTVTAIIEDIALSLSKWGFNRMVVVCGHGEGANMDAIIQGLTNAHEKNPAFEGTVSRWLMDGMVLMNGVLKGEHPEWDLHAGEIETSIMLYKYPELVDTNILPELEPNWNGETLFQKMAEGVDNFIDLGAPLAYFGDPRIATAETGDKAYDVFADFIVDETLALLDK